MLSKSVEVEPAASVVNKSLAACVNFPAFDLLTICCSLLNYIFTAFDERTQLSELSIISLCYNFLIIMSNI